MPIDWTAYSRSQLREASIARFQQGGGSSPEVLLIEINGEQAVLKDQNNTAKIFAALLGGVLTRREARALRQLASLESAPKLLSCPDSRSFLMSYQTSLPITEVDCSQIHWPDFLRQLSHAIDAMHALGITHNDLRNAENILVMPNGKPLLIDFAGCFWQGCRYNLVRRWVFNKLKQVDRSAITKLKLRHAPELLLESDIHNHEIAGKWLTRLTHGIRRVSKTISTLGHRKI